MPAFHPDSLAMKSAQGMTDGRALADMIAEMQKRPDKRATAEEKVRIVAIIRRMPAEMQARLKPTAVKLGLDI